MDVLHVTHYNNELGEVVEYEMLDPQCLAEMMPLCKFRRRSHLLDLLYLRLVRRRNRPLQRHSRAVLGQNIWGAWPLPFPHLPAILTLPLDVAPLNHHNHHCYTYCLSSRYLTFCLRWGWVRNRWAGLIAARTGRRHRAGGACSWRLHGRRRRLMLILRCASSCTGYKNASLRYKVGVSSWQPAGHPMNYVNVSKDLWDAKVRYGMEIGYIFALPAIDMPAVYYSRLRFRSITTDTYLRRCSYFFGCN